MSKKYTVKNIEYLKVNEANKETYWKELGLNIDFLNETKLKNINESFEIEIKKLKKSVLMEVSGFLLGDDKNTDIVKDILNSDVSSNQKVLFLLIKEFTLRKKKTIQEFIQFTKNTIEYSSEVALVWSIYNEAPNLLFEVSTYHNWRNRSTDKLYTFTKKQSEQKILKIAKEAGFRDSLCNELHKASGQANFYKLYSYSKLGTTIIFHLYKKVNDKTVPDFEQPIRNREVKSVMFSIDLEKQYLEIRDYTSKEKKALLELLSSMLKSALVEVVSDPYIEFESESLKNSLLGIDISGKDIQIEDLIITAITFNRSSLPKSPLLHFELENDDVMEAVYQAYQDGIVDLKDLKDIKSLKLKTKTTSRLIRAIPLESGDVIFSLDDSTLDKPTKLLLGEKFKEKFGIPLNQPISNIYFDGGLEEKVDYLMGLSNEELFDHTTKDKFEQLVKEKLITKNKVKITYCPICKETFSEGTKECEECERELKHRFHESLEINQKKAINYFDDKIKELQSYPWSETRESNITIDKEIYHFLVLTNDDSGDEIRFLLTTKQLSKKMVNKIHRMVIPTVIVYVGSSAMNIDKYNDNCIITKNFGYFYIMNDSKQFLAYIIKTHKDFIQRRKMAYAKSGLESFKTIKNWINTGGEYTDKEFEHDVFAMINDITYNNVQWGAKYSGKIVPEGAFTLSFKVNAELGKSVYTYDCKLTEKEKGYGLNISEHRKAAQYLRIMSQSDFLKDYLNGRDISAHLIISNKVDVKKINAMNNHLLIEKINSKVKLIKIETLLRIYEHYLDNYCDISTKPNYFKKTLIQLINKDSDELKISEVEKEFARLLKSGLMEQPPLDMSELTKDALDATDLDELQIKS
ncbi:hypothetical protein V2I71_12675 [Peribacillus frigoritolerans]|uniref:hypothetical protein n=1 Tax=Peribacillus frigoritolerans TaxID=450367 RepID=UPI002ED36B60|nr:hypothetical protein V2I71_12675 [Peribacillus frigoritolerans]